MTEVQQPIQHTEQQQPPFETQAAPTTTQATERRPWYKRASFKIGAVGVGGLLAAGGAFALTELNDTTDEPYSPPPEYVPAPEFEYGSVGNIDISQILPTDRTIAGTRDNGQRIEVPRLRETNDPAAFAESALALVAGYVSTGNEQMLTALTNNDNIQQGFRNFRQDYAGESSNGYIESSDGKDAWQLAIYDLDDDPATFTARPDMPGQYVVEQTGGTLYVNFWSDDEWQGDETHQTDLRQTYNFAVRDLYLKVEELPGGQNIIVGINWDPEHS